MSKKKLRIGLVGAGGIGRTHLAAYRSVPEVIVAAVCDPVEKAARTAAEPLEARTYGEVAEMLASEQLDAVDICTPTVLHPEAALRAIDLGINVLCEKPLGPAAGPAREMVKAAARKGTLLMTAFCHRFHPPIVFVKRLVDEGAMGEIVMFRNRFAGSQPEMENRWFSRKEIAGGGAFLDTSIHSIDLFRFLVGEIDRVQAVMRRTNPAISEVEDTAIALVSTSDQRMGVIEACWSAPGGYNVVEVYGTKGTAMVHYWDGFASRYKTHHMNDWAPIETEGPDRFVGEIQHFVDACLGRGPLKVTGEDGLRACEVADQAYEAAGWT